MKCLSCGSEIPNNSESCPFCGAVVEKNESLMDTATLPVTPSEIQLPADQAKMANTGAINIITDDMELPNVAEEKVEESDVVEENTELPEIKEEPVVKENVTTDIPLEETEPVVITGGPINTTPETPVTTDSSLNSELETVTFSKEQVPAKEKKPFPIKLVLIIIAVLVVIGGCGFAYYYVTQYMSASSRMEAVIDNIFEANISEVKNEKVEKKSGRYNANLNINENDNIYKIEFDGDYGIDLKAKRMNYSFNLKDLKLANDIIIDKNNPINLAMFIDESTISMDLANFFDKYISIQSPEIGAIFNSIEQNDIDYSNIVNSLKTAFKNATKELSTTQSVENVTFDGNTKKANVITIKLTSDNQKVFVDTFIDTLLSDQLFINDMALLSGVEPAKMEADLNNSKASSYEDKGTVIKICTAMFDKELIGIRIANNGDTIDITAIDNGYKFSAIENTKKVFDLTYTYVKEETVKEIKEDFGISLVLNQTDNVIKIDLNLSSSSDVNPTIKDKENKETIPVEYLDQETQAQILNNILSYGKLGAMLQGLITTNQTEMVSMEEIEMNTMCAQAFECSETIEGYATCKTMDETGLTTDIICPMMN